ncbi:hypothetical protein [Nitrososphaera viennensis]|uniref:YokE-like PH domain-containing protein n=1 Tax=Nitrososphaera viennensis TaxID=1034015 RepID=A0A977IFP4_9ARCH|nr:hypothetical protein [Nitrososphaera viennensis]UVS69878.1 hypothetical protein NWT39_03600 [Nitrososphaera viennensis]
MPSENIRLASDDEVEYGDKKYRIVITDKRFILYARRGTVFKSDDVVSERLQAIHGFKYSEKGTLFRTATISIITNAKMEIRGSPDRMKPLFHTLQSTIGA